MSDDDSLPLTRRQLLASVPATLLSVATIGLKENTANAAPARSTSFPKDFVWAAATAGHQVEGNNVNSDIWLLEHVKPSMFVESSGDACDSLHRWREDLDLVKSIGLNSYRFSLEWSRIEPAEGEFSNAMLDHYARIIDGCRERGIKPIVTFNHFSCPRWFAAAGHWVNPCAPDLFARYCEHAAQSLAAGMAYATTLNEPNIMRLLKWLPLGPDLPRLAAASSAAAARAAGSDTFYNAMVGDAEKMTPPLIDAHVKGYQAIKSVRPELPVGVSIALSDDQAVGDNSRRDEIRRDVYQSWLDTVAAHGDFVGVQNYSRLRLDKHGIMKPPSGAALTQMGFEYYPPSLGNAIRYAHQATRKPVFVTENGIATADDTMRVRYIPEAIAGMKGAIDDGVPVIGYVHWSLLDNFEWGFGYRLRYGLVAVDRTTFERIPKPSAAVLGAIAKANRLV